MTKSKQSYTNARSSESMDVGSMPMASGGSISIPLEVIRGVADQDLVKQVEELTQRYNELLREDDRRARAYMRMGADLNDVKEENERLIKELAEAKQNAGINTNRFIPAIDCRYFRNNQKKNANKRMDGSLLGQHVRTSMPDR